MSYSDSSQLLNKQAELKALQTKYNTYTSTYQPIVAAPSSTGHKNAISLTPPPQGIRAGEDFGEYWKFVSSGDIDASACWTSATRDPRIFKKVVYTGVYNTDNTWNKQCYGLVWNAPTDASYNADANGYTTMVTADANSGFTSDGVALTYTKTNITSQDKLNEAAQIADLKSRIDSLIEEIALVAGASINSELTSLSQTSADQKSLIQNINQYMNTSAQQIDASNSIIDKRKNLNMLYEDINNQITLKTKKYKFIMYFVVGLIIIMSYLSYVSKLSLLEQITELGNWMSWGWWTNWGVITFVVVLLILSSFGWDMKGNIAMIFRYISDPDFWTGQMWWVGISFLLIIVVFAYASFKSFFNEAAITLEKLGE